MKVIFLHLSDIHISGSSDPILQRTEAIASSTFKYLPVVEAVFILLSGDIAQSGKANQYELADTFIRKIISSIKAEKQGLSVHVICAPGNHDCDFSKTGNARKAIISTVIGQDGQNIDGDIVDACTGVQKSYFDFQKALESSAHITYDDKLVKEYAFDFSGKRIIFDCLNVSWMSQLDEPQGRLIFPVDNYSTLEDRVAAVKVVLMHHPLNWYTQSTYQKFRHYVRRLANIVISGHEHSPLSGENFDTTTEHSVYIEAGALQDRSDYGNSYYNIVTIDLDDSTYLCELHEWKLGIYKVVEAENKEWTTFRILHQRALPGFRISKEFLSNLEDPGGPFRHRSQEKIKLGEIFVYPDLRLSTDEKNETKDVSAAKLLTLDNIKPGAVIRGADKCGKTSLLFQLYRHYHNEALIPVYLSESELRRFSVKDVNATIEDAIKCQYGADAVVLFDQTARSKKILLLDNLDRIGSAQKHRADVLRNLLSKFDCVIATSSDLFEVGELLSVELNLLLSTWNQYDILPFGHKLRLELIRRWDSLGLRNETHQSGTIAYIDRAEKLLNAVVGKQVVPCVPFYLLTLLQSFEASQQAELQNSAFGYYYQYLITQSMGRVSIKREQLDEFFNYCCQLAWFLNGQEAREASATELKHFNSLYSSRYYSVDFDTRMNQLVSSEILDKRGDYFYFRYPYYYYFFIGKYLSDHITDQSVMDLIKHHSSHLYVADYANIILFLCHHSKNTYIRDCVTDVLRTLFSDKQFMHFDGDTDLLNQLVEVAPRLVYEDGDDAITNRAKARAIQDDAEKKAPNPAKLKEQPFDKLDLSSKINLMFKTAEILGQILKNHYGSLSNDTKREYLHEIFQGPLRGLRQLLETAMSEQDALEQAVQAEIDKRYGEITQEEKLKIARRLLFDLSTLISVIFVKKIADSINSEYLRDVIADVTRDNSSNAYKLIELSVKLDSPEVIPFKEIKLIKEASPGNRFLERMLQAQAVMHLYMFSTTEREKQKLCEMLGIQLQHQRLVDLRSKDTKKLKKPN